MTNSAEGLLFLTRHFDCGRAKRNIMNGPAKFLFVFLIMGVPPPCAAGLTLSIDEAAEILTAHFKYPVAVSTQIVFRENGGEMLAYLKKEGYIVTSAAQTCCGDFYATTGKGKSYLGELVKHLSNGDLFVDCVYARRVLKSVEAVRVYPKKKIATVEYIEGLEPNEPVYSSVFMKGEKAPQEIDLGETRLKKVNLKYHNKTWRIER